MAHKYRGLAGRAAHKTFGSEYVVKFPSGDQTLTLRYYPAESIIGQDGYAQAMVEVDTVVFDIAELEEKGLTADDIERDLKLILDGEERALGEVYPSRGGFRAAEVV